MVKFLPILLIIIALGGFLFVKLRPQPLTTPAPKILDENLPITKDTSSDERIKILQDAVINLIKQVNTLNSAVKSTDSLEKKLTALETTVNNLQNRISNLEKGSTTQTTQTNSIQAPIFIPLGSGSSSSSDWTSIDGAAININPSDYPGYKGVQFETSLKVFQTGTAYVRLYNKDDGTAFGELSTTSTSDTVLSSGTFTLPSAKKTYVLQLKSQISGYATTATNARIKVNF